LGQQNFFQPEECEIPSGLQFSVARTKVIAEEDVFVVDISDDSKGNMIFSFELIFFPKLLHHDLIATMRHNIINNN